MHYFKQYKQIFNDSILLKMTSVERVSEYTSLESEKLKQGDINPDKKLAV